MSKSVFGELTVKDVAEMYLDCDDATDLLKTLVNAGVYHLGQDKHGQIVRINEDQSVEVALFNHAVDRGCLYFTDSFTNKCIPDESVVVVEDFFSNDDVLIDVDELHGPYQYMVYIAMRDIGLRDKVIGLLSNKAFVMVTTVELAETVMFKNEDIAYTVEGLDDGELYYRRFSFHSQNRIVQKS